MLDCTGILHYHYLVNLIMFVTRNWPEIVVVLVNSGYKAFNVFNTETGSGHKFAFNEKGDFASSCQ